MQKFEMSATKEKLKAGIRIEHLVKQLTVGQKVCDSILNLTPNGAKLERL
jgi:hypothetical protein